MYHVRKVIEEGIPGDLAEVGVWRGNSAVILAHYAKKANRKAFFFDTFTGFDPRDLSGIDPDPHPDHFLDTSVELVRRNVGHDDVSRYIVGCFPESVTDEVKDRTYALVHLDCDLYLPMKAGLNFFYERMQPGGMLIMHDYGSGNWNGVKKAVDEFCAETGEFVTLWPDKSGSASIRKSMRVNPKISLL